MGVLFEDSLGHQLAQGTASTALTAGAVSTTAVGTIAPTTSAGASPTVTISAGVCNDARGTFTLSPVTGGGAQAAGEVALITFAAPYPAAPRAIMVSVTDNAGGSGSVIAASATSIGVGSFKLNVGAALTTAHTYACSYNVLP